MSKVFVGFGFGPIQSALFLLEAYRSGNFSRFAVAEVDQKMVDAVRANRGVYTVNIAGPHGIERFNVEGVELYQPSEAKDRRALVDAISKSDEMATALPSVRFYDVGNETSVARLIAEGVRQRTQSPPTIIYASENHNHAAEILGEDLAKYIGSDRLRSIQALNTVIGKMSGVITDPVVMKKLDLAPIVPGFGRAILVEQFNRILVSEVTRREYRRGIEVFVEKPDLLPFEEAKLYGHNAIHALIAYLSDLRGLMTIAEAAVHGDIMGIARAAFIEESGASLIKRHAKLGDPLFTLAGYRAYADDLLDRMVNPFLHDLVERVGRDHVRKLAYEDRLYGTMALALKAGIQPRCLALGAAAGVVSLIRRLKDQELASGLSLPKDFGELTPESLAELLQTIWSHRQEPEAQTLIDLTWEAFLQLNRDGWLKKA